MKMNEYQEQAASTAIYGNHTNDGLTYTALGLAGEAGEVADKVKKILRGDSIDLATIRDELGDVLWYVAMVAKELGYPLDVVAKRNIEKLASRKERGVTKGDGDNR